MTAYNNFTLDFPKRLAELDQRFRSTASDLDRDVTYTLMKLAAAFLLPFERIDGSSGARKADISDSQSIRKYLELDKPFSEASYYSTITQWSLFDVDNFDCGPCNWNRNPCESDFAVHEILKTIRHSVAHSNLFFGGELQIEDIYLGSRRERDRNTTKYRVVQCTHLELNHLVDAWVTNVQKLRVSPHLIWRKLDEAA